MPLFAEDFKELPLWVGEVSAWDDASADLPARADVVVIGAGYTGLNAAIETARAGRSTLVIDAGPPGHGCSTRNGGQISTSIKPSLETLSKRVGRDRALAIRQTGVDALPTDVMDRLYPTNRNITDTCKVIYYYRPSPDRQRVVFGGRVSAGDTSIKESARRLHRQAAHLFPELGNYRVSHAWSGQVAYSFDELMHTGTHDGVHYSMGYCGSGVSMASYMGMRMGQKVLELPEGRTALDDLPFPTRPLYYGKPWFLPPLVAWYRWRDRMQARRSESH